MISSTEENRVRGNLNMSITEAIADIQYVTNPTGERTNVIVPLGAWESLLAALVEMAARLEDQEDVAVLQAWLRTQATGTVEMISLDALEQELRNDGLLSS
jgi:hypothetical protein